MDVDLLIRGGTVVDGTRRAAGRSRRRRARRPDRGRRDARPTRRAATVDRRHRSRRRPGLHRRPRPLRDRPPRQRRDLGLGPPGRHHAPDRPGRLRLGAPAAPADAPSCGARRRSPTASPDLRPDWPTIDAYLAGFAGDDPAQRRPDGAAPGDPLRGPGLGRSPARLRPSMDRMRGPHPRLDGGRRGRAQHRARLPAGGELRRPTSSSSSPGSSREYGGVYAAHMRYNGRRQARRLPRVDRDRPRARASRSGCRTSPSTTRPSRCSRRPAGRASTSASTGTSTRRARATCSSGCRRRTRSAGSTRPSSACATTPRTDARSRRCIEEQIAVTPCRSAAASTSRTRGPGRYIGMSIARGRRRARHRRSARRRST